MLDLVSEHLSSSDEGDGVCTRVAVLLSTCERSRVSAEGTQVRMTWRHDTDGSTVRCRPLARGRRAESRLRRVGVHVPGQLSVIGVDDHDVASVVDLTTVSQPVREQGLAAAMLLLDAVSVPQDTQRVALPTRLVVRGTTAPPRH